MTNAPFKLTPNGNPFELAEPALAAKLAEETLHRYSFEKSKSKKSKPPEKCHKCQTDDRGFETPNNHSPTEIRVDTHLGFVPLWAKNSILRWRFKESSFAVFQQPEQAKAAVRQLMAEALKEWRDSVPVIFTEQRDLFDFEVVMIAKPDCDENGGCVLASAFFPDGGRHELNIFPTMFEQSRPEQVETLAHEFGHIFGLRHWFAAIDEAAWPSALFGKNDHFTIMNYGDASVMTDADRNDLKALYRSVWDGSLTQINGTPIRLFKPFSSHL